MKKLLSNPTGILATLIIAIFIGFGLILALRPDTEERMSKVEGDIVALAVSTAVDEKAFTQCYTSAEAAEKVESEIKEGFENGLNFTPSAFVVNPETKKAGLLNSSENAEAMIQAIINDTPNDELYELPEFLVEKEGEFIRGNPDAKVSMIIYSDFDCPACKNFHQFSAPEILATYPEIKWIHRNLPLRSIHPFAHLKARAVDCVGEVGGTEPFWALTDLLFAM